MPDRVTYNRDEPPVLQVSDFDCAPAALTWGLRSVGRQPTLKWITDTMIEEGYESSAQGLLDGSGGGLSHFIREQYGEYLYDSNNSGTVSFDALAAEFMAPHNPYPGLIGGHCWGGEGHWVGLRSYRPVDDVLVLANPAGDGPVFGGQTMNREQFPARGPFSLVRVLHKDLLSAPVMPVPMPIPPPPPIPEPVPPPPVPTPDDRIPRAAAKLREALAILET